MSRLFVLALPPNAYRHSSKTALPFCIGGNHEYAYRISFAPDLQVKSMIWPRKNPELVQRGRYSRPWHYRHKGLLELTVLYPWKGCTASGYTPRHAPQASVFSARLRLDYENFDAPVFTGLLRVTIGGKTDTKSILMVTPYTKRQSRFGTVSISKGGSTDTISTLMDSR